MPHIVKSFDQDLDEIKNADEVFYCGTLSEIIPIVKIDDKVIGNSIF